MSRVPVPKSEVAKPEVSEDTTKPAPVQETTQTDGPEQTVKLAPEPGPTPRATSIPQDEVLNPGAQDAKTSGTPRVQIKYLPHALSLPPIERKTAMASGYDLYAAIDKPINLGTLGDRALIPTGVCVAIPPGYEGQVRPRSGLAAKNGISIVNTPGTIDADYRGEIQIILVNLSTRKFAVEPGMRIAQLVFTPVALLDLDTVEELPETERGEGGFGSTGVR